VNNIEVLLDRAAGNLSIIATDDSSGTEVEHTLSVEAAWNLVAELNKSIQALLPQIIAKGSVCSQEQVIPVSEPSRAPERVKDAVLESVGADQRRPRHMPPGSPADASTKKGLRNLYEPVVEEPVVKRGRKKAIPK